MAQAFSAADYERAAAIQMDCTCRGDYLRGNLASDQLLAYNTAMIEDFAGYNETVDFLLESGSVNSCIWVSNVAKALNYRLDGTIKRLSAIAGDPTLGIIAFNAEMMLMQLTQAK